MNRFGETLKRLREQMHLRQNDLAEMAGVERSTVANWERGAKQPSLDTLVRLSEIFGVSPDELVGTTLATKIHLAQPHLHVVHRVWHR
ncbi:MAG: helix-turn-helix transcriptional regulator [Thermoanaerobacteraceae bacterium]|nr:helix-turn-helix transcriptional regulator [Thermoanaerobacteraceae bacterium]